MGQYKLCITEKKSVATGIASIVGATTLRDGYYEGESVRVTWTIGHLCCLYEPHDYRPDWKRWCLSSLPMLPVKYDIKVIDDAGIKRQFQVVEKLMADAAEIINCGDAGQEGELIQRWVMRKAGAHCPVSRLWISSLTDEAIRRGFAELKPQSEYDSLFYAGMCRAISDWVLGMNATRLYTLKYGKAGTVLSIGRVQTPTLALIVGRQREIDNFTPKDTWELHTEYRNVDFTCQGDRYDNEADGNAALEQIRTLPLTVIDVSKKKGHEAPPRLFDLTGLQVESNKRWGWSADRTLQLIQTLYEKKLTTYPRVDTTYLSDDIHPKVASILKSMTPYADKVQPVLAKPIPKSKKNFDNTKVTDHHAIIPTGVLPSSSLSQEEKMLYHLVALRFIAAFYPDCIFEQTVVSAKVGQYDFKATGKVITESGWRVIYAKEQKEDASDDEDSGGSRILPEFVKGESGSHRPTIERKTSQPPKPFTEGTLLRAMESCGRTVDNEELRELMKENGIGRPSTRAAIIETLFKRRYIRRERKNIVPTQAGTDLIDTINEELLKSPKLTGLWENKLRRIEQGKYNPAEFVREINEMVRTIVLNVLNDNTVRSISVARDSDATPKPHWEKTSEQPKPKRITKLEQVVCPLCGKGHIVRGRTAFGCSEYASGCSFRVSFDVIPADTKPGVLARKIACKRK